MERHVAILPCRSGSKSIRDKNLLRLEQKTLVRVALELALDSQVFSRVIISTDYQRQKLGIEGLTSTAHTQLIYTIRPSELAADDTRMIEAVRHALNNNGGDETWVWILQPTSPFRSREDFRRIKEIIATGKYASLISWKPLKEPIDRSATWKNDRAYKITQTNFKNKEELQGQVHRSGNFYVAKRQDIMDMSADAKKFNWMIEPSYAYMMGNINPNVMTQKDYLHSRYLGINIDGPEDWIMAKYVVNNGYVRIK